MKQVSLITIKIYTFKLTIKLKPNIDISNEGFVDQVW